MSSRRVSLGPLSASTLNTRSTSTGRLSIGAEKPSRLSLGGSAKRLSVGGSATNSAPAPAAPAATTNAPARKSSLVPRPSGSLATRAKDPRNITDKQYVSESIRQLMTFLVQNDFKSQISMKTLQRPSTGEFQNIVRFLFKQLDPHYEISDHIADEIIGFFKFFQYPSNISKGNIMAVGSPHAWPHLLAAILWLVELINYHKESGRQESNQFFHEMDLSDQGNSEKAFHGYVAKAYHFFITGNDEQLASVHQQFLNSFENKNTMISDQIDAKQKRSLALASEIDDLKRKTASLPEVDARRKELQREHGSLLATVEEKKKKSKQLEVLLNEKKAELQKGKQLVQSITEEIRRLKTIVANQEISPEDVTNMINERDRLEDAQKAASEHRQSLQRKIWELEMNLRDKVQSLEDTVKAYHSIAEDLKMIPQDARNARGENLSIEIDIRAKRREGLLKTPIKTHILPILQEVRKELNEMTLELRSELITEQDQTEDLEAKRQELVQSCETYEAKAKRAEATYRREKESLDQSNEIHLKEIDNMESRLLQLTDTASEEARITSGTRRIAEANALRNARTQEYLRVKKHLMEAIMEVMSMYANHREHFQRLVDSLKSRYQNRLEELQTPGNGKLEEYAKEILGVTNALASVFPPPPPPATAANSSTLFSDSFQESMIEERELLNRFDDGNKTIV